MWLIVLGVLGLLLFVMFNKPQLNVSALYKRDDSDPKPPAA